MGTIIQFPADAPARRSAVACGSEVMGTVLILPVIRIERDTDGSTGSAGPQERKAPGRRRRRR
ncbi:MAG: hypothetical protein JOY90_03190 [Bradyrhizobium sp.]|jgi:hypothetical protein|uniref:hypothetical protein n=1 Tax=Bradyrhizobium sp. TaxID=376 RepID=UPI001DBDB0AB|nr:hypothetical protein [Bradyrhizobium sp.]MBV9559456.1 hypothetical protein [Bradyrhizobium sp.]